ncbi:YccF domain-containing protein [Porphyromonas levii]|uniref:YccF domain-containing protein n=1 Tax=Porphyromonas levii TaxID=28114 RepID=UPI001B8D9EBB|nr:YccF domain-containing protein [Porphyromonas levii]MBR8758666.1 Inner membrane protein YccF [Porphyromonas levii]
MGKLLGNIIWWLFGGIATALEYFSAGLVLCVTIIGIPLGLQLFKLGLVMLFPFGSKVSGASTNPIGVIGNVLWALLAGIWIALTHILIGVILFITIIGIPWGQKHFKFAKVAFTPFGREVEILA